MNELQAYFEAVLKATTDMRDTAQKLAELTLIMKGYEQGKEMAESSPFKPQTAETDFVRNYPQIGELPPTGLTESLKTEKGIHQFTKKEINSMPEKFKVIFNKKIREAHWRIRKGGYPELRCTIDGISYSGTGKTEKAAVENFIKSLYRDENENEITKNIKFKNYTKIWLETVKKPNIKPTSYDTYVAEVNRYLFPVFGDRTISSIKKIEIQTLINEYVAKGRVSTANKIYNYLSSILNYAATDGLVDKTIMARVIVKKCRQVHGTALSREEEKVLLDALKSGDIYAQIFVILLYTGMRKSELQTARIEGDWIVINSAKQRLGDEKIRRVPITPMLQKVMPLIDFEAAKKIDHRKFLHHLHNYLPTHHPHELRHTFITRCQECGVRREIVSLWVGHNADNSITSTVYTHLETNKQVQLEEAKKVDYEV